jgi:hypothetical protein
MSERYGMKGCISMGPSFLVVCSCLDSEAFDERHLHGIPKSSLRAELFLYREFSNRVW